MTDKPFNWDEAFEEVARENRHRSDVAENNPTSKAKRAAEIQRDIERGIRDKDGAFIVPDQEIETDEENEEE